MRVYLASWYASRDDMNSRAKQLTDAGIDVTSRWLQETGDLKIQTSEVDSEFLRLTAGIDLEDIMSANIVVLNTPSDEDLKIDMPVSNWARGGRHFEAGFQYALMMFLDWLPSQVVDNRSLMVVGKKENVFYHLTTGEGHRASGLGLPAIEYFANWDETLKAILDYSRTVNANMELFSTNS